MFDAATGKELGKVPDRYLAFAPDGKTVAVFDSLGKVIDLCAACRQ